MASLAVGITGELDDGAAASLHELNDVLAWRLPELVGWDDEAYARRYADDVRRVREAEAGRTAFAELSAALGGLDSLVGRRHVADGVGRVLSGVTVDKVQPGTADRPAVYVGTRGR